MLKAPLREWKVGSVGEVEVSSQVFGLQPRSDILSRVVEWQLARRRSGAHKTKGISEVSGTTKKPYKQKGTGRARQGSLRSPQFRGGGIIFGPVVRSHAFSLQKKVRKLGLRMALSSKLDDSLLFVVEHLDIGSFKTKDLSTLLPNVCEDFSSVLFIGDDAVPSDFAKASSALIGIDVLPVCAANVYDILSHKSLVVTRGALCRLEARLAAGANVYSSQGEVA